MHYGLLSLNQAQHRYIFFLRKRRKQATCRKKLIHFNRCYSNNSALDNRPGMSDCCLIPGEYIFFRHKIKLPFEKLMILSVMYCARLSRSSGFLQNQLTELISKQTCRSTGTHYHGIVSFCSYSLMGRGDQKIQQFHGFLF